MAYFSGFLAITRTNRLNPSFLGHFLLGLRYLSHQLGMSKYNPSEIERKWQERWEREGVARVANGDKAEKAYMLVMFPYPSGAGLHVGHVESYAGTDIVSRYLRMRGKKVLQPMGWDAFGLPAENYAIKTGVHPAITTAENIATFKRQIMSLGLLYDWDREVNTTDPAYYKWTQWIFIQLFKHGLAYEAQAPINWCPKDKTGLANEEVVAGKCERCGAEVEKKNIRQWLVRITDPRYIERLANDVDRLDWPESIKTLQKNWIGKSEGADIRFAIANTNEHITVFTTRPDTLFGVTYVVLAPEHALVEKLKTQATNRADVEAYIEKTKNTSEVDRMAGKDSSTSLGTSKTGVPLAGVFAINPANGEQVPVWIADYVLASYGTGAVMAVPAHDDRDFAFAKQYNLPMREVVKGGNMSEAAFTGNGVAINSDFLNDLPTWKAKDDMTSWLSEHGKGEKRVQYHLRDWLFSRQRYWGEPIPIVHCEKCGKVAVPESGLPLELPKVDKYEPTGTGESPLAALTDWVNTTCPTCKGPARRETNTMPQWAGSNWYFLRYCDPKNEKELASAAALKEWLPIDAYVGGAEHAVLHLLYARFIYKFLFDIGAVPKECGDEPFTKLRNQGMILGEDNQKMSKSRGNVVNPDEMVERFGADTLRMYEMFMGPFDQEKPWDTNGMVGVRRFLERVWSLRMTKLSTDKADKASPLTRLTHKTIKKVGEDIAEFRFNTAVSAMMILVNEMNAAASVPQSLYEKLLLILAPFAPHIAEELWATLGHTDLIARAKWPEYDEVLTVDDEVTIPVQVNGKLRDTLTMQATASKEDIERTARASEKVQKCIAGKEIIRVVIVPGRMCNIVVQE